MDRSIGIDIPVRLGLTLVKRIQFHLSHVRMLRIGHLLGLYLGDTHVLTRRCHELRQQCLLLFIQGYCISYCELNLVVHYYC